VDLHGQRRNADRAELSSGVIFVARLTSYGVRGETCERLIKARE